MRVALPERVARPAPAGGAPTGLVALFLLLVTTVVATIGILGLLAWLAVGEHRQALGAEFRRCEDLEQGPPQTLIEANDASHRLLDCLAPTYRQQAGWALAAVAVLIVVTAALYCAYPRWLVHRRRFVPLRESGELAEYLDGLRDLVGLRARPVYLLGSRSGTTDALTFGALRRRYVALDAGLLRSFDADRARFRAVVLHELAHARGQDVHITYLTKSIWWAFVAVAWAPALAGVLAAGSWWGLVVVAALLVLTALVLCTRNAILRERELHADGVAAALDGPGTALAELVADERPRGSWRALVGHHPSPALRRRVVADPALLLRPRWWEMPVAGLTTGVVAANLGFVVAIALPTLPGSGQLLTGLLTSPGLVVPLAVAAWRVAAVAPGRLPASLPVFALAWAGAFLVGQQVALLGLIRASERTVVPTPDLASALVLAATALVVAVWAAGASRVVAGAFDRPPRWALPAVVAGGAVAFAPWFGSWSVWSSIDRVGWWAFADELARFELDVPGASSWVAGAAHWLGLLHMPLYSMVFFPAVVPALALLWLVPALVTRAGRPVLDVRRALRAGAVGVAAFTVAAVALVVAARFALPAEARGSDGFRVGAHYALVDLAVLVQAVVAFAVRGRHRPVLVPLAALVSGLGSAVVLLLGVETLGRALDLWQRAPQALFRWPDLAFAAETTQQVVIGGAAAAVVGALLGAPARRRAAPPAPRRDTAALAVLTAATVVLAAAAMPAARHFWLTSTTTGVQPATGAQCLLGTWVERSRTTTLTLSTEVGPMEFHGSGSVQAFDDDGTVVVQFQPILATQNGHVVVLEYSGAVTARYRVDGDRITYSDVSPGITWSVSVDGHRDVMTGEVREFSPDEFTCEGNDMTQTGENYSITLARAAHHR